MSGGRTVTVHSPLSNASIRTTRFDSSVRSEPGQVPEELAVDELPYAVSDLRRLGVAEDEPWFLCRVDAAFERERLDQLVRGRDGVQRREDPDELG
ncbi:hypothetical protein [Curtobacterium flaccumfaciens]|uniref:hypothetical protein n=1 Tax=Curtobacterium flaccumfaciens TaxID=2035 RepID=UPI0039911DDC